MGFHGGVTMTFLINISYWLINFIFTAFEWIYKKVCIFKAEQLTQRFARFET